MIDSSRIDTAVEFLAAGRLERVRMDLLPSHIRPSGEDEAYAVPIAADAFISPGPGTTIAVPGRPLARA